MAWQLDPLSPNGISKKPADVIPYFAGGSGKPSLIDSVNGKHGAVRITAGTNVTVDNSGDSIQISATGGGGSGGAVDSVNGQTGTVVLDADDISDTTTANKFVTAADKTVLSNTSGTNTGDQDLSGYATTASLATVATTGSYTDLSSKPTIPSVIDDLSDVTITTPSNGQVLKYNGTAWVNDTASTGSGGTTLPADAAGWLHDDGSGTLAWTTPTKSDVGLGNVDNTSDATKNSAVATLTNKDLTSVTNTFPTFNQNTTGSAASLTTARTFRTNLASTATASFDGTANVTPGVTGTLPVANGGTGAATLTGIVKGNGTAAMTAVTAPSGALVGTTDTQTLTNKTLTTPKIDTIKDTSGSTIASLSATASAVNYVDISNASTGFAPAITANGSDTNLNLFLRGKGSGSTIMADGSGNNTFVGVGNGSSPVNYLTATNADTANAPKLSALGSDTNINLNLVSKGTGTIQANSVDVATVSGSQTLTNKTLSTGSTIDANVTVTEVLKKVYPVGSIYIATISTNPGTLLGFGTWVAYGAGQVLVGKASSGTFATAGATGGEETHVLTIAEMPSHTHGIDTYTGGINGGAILTSNNTGVNNNRDTKSSGGGGAHNNLQPYIVVYMWNRTA